MRLSPAIREFDPLAEALPITLAGILMNLAGRQIAEFYGGPFVDMTGTAFTALLLGPWWAAAVAAATTIVNGNFFESYFPFGVVNVAGALAWGYLARWGDLRNRVFARHRGALGHFLIWTVFLSIVGGFVCGLASTCVKLVLYPELGRPFIQGPLYVSAHAGFQRYFGPTTPEVLTLAAVDQMRDFKDKFIVVPAAMLLAVLSRIGPVFGRMSRETTARQRMRTDAASILIFIATYTAFILLALLTRPVISIPGSAHDVAWLQRPLMAILMTAPLAAAILAFQFLTFGASDPIPRHLHTLYRQRRDIALQLVRAGGQRITLLASFAVQALGAGVSLWPLRHVIDNVFGVPLALAAVTTVLAGYLLLARVFYTMLQRAMNKAAAVRQWQLVGGGSAASAALVELLESVFGSYVHIPVPQVARRNGLAYSLGFLNREQRGPLEEILFGRAEDTAGERVAVLAAIEPPCSLSMPVLRDLSTFVRDLAAGLIVLATTTSRVADRELIEGLRVLRKAGAEVLLFDWAELYAALAAMTLSGRPQVPWRRARARALNLLNKEDEKFALSETDHAMWLARRALPSLKAVIEQLPKKSTVFDLGSGYGRHTLTASLAGHRILAVDRKAAVCERLRSDLPLLPRGSGEVTVISSDFLDLSAEAAGPADLVICTGVLQHAMSAEDLAARLTHIGRLASLPAALIYIEMLFDMLFDAQPPKDGRIAIARPDFEAMLCRHFPAGSWAVERTFGPARQMQSFQQGGRSFEPPARKIECTAAEYLVRRMD